MLSSIKLAFASLILLFTVPVFLQSFLAFFNNGEIIFSKMLNFSSVCLTLLLITIILLKVHENEVLATEKTVFINNSKLLKYGLIANAISFFIGYAVNFFTQQLDDNGFLVWYPALSIIFSILVYMLLRAQLTKLTKIVSLLSLIHLSLPFLLLCAMLFSVVANSSKNIETQRKTMEFIENGN